MFAAPRAIVPAAAPCWRYLVLRCDFGIFSVCILKQTEKEKWYYPENMVNILVTNDQTSVTGRDHSLFGLF
jgi:hypothetical protein